MSLLEDLKKTIPLRDFTADNEAKTLEHVLGEPPHPGKTRWGCTIAHVLYKELAGRPELQHLALELAWIIWRMSGAIMHLKAGTYDKLGNEIDWDQS